MERRIVPVEIKDEVSGKVLFEKEFEVPVGWSDRAATIVASKYATPDETSAYQIISRVVGQIKSWGTEQGYFSTGADGVMFAGNLFNLMVDQKAFPNSPVLFNFGVPGNKAQGSACQPYGSLINTERGLIPIGKIVEDNMVGLSVFGGGKIIAVKKNGIRDVLRITTKAGLTVETTEDHLLYSRKLQGRFYDTIDPSNKSFSRADSRSLSDNLVWCACKELEPIELPSEGDLLLQAEAYAVGWIQGAGFAGQYNHATSKSLILEAMFVTQEEEDTFVFFFKKLFPDVSFTVREYYTPNGFGYKRLRVYGEKFRHFVERNNLRLRRLDMEVPEWLLTAPLSVVRQYLRAWFQADGFVTLKKDTGSTLIGLTIISTKVAITIQLLLQRFGIFSRQLTKKETRENRQDLQSISIQVFSEVVKFRESIGFVGSEKLDKLKQYSDISEKKGRRSRLLKKLDISKIEKIGVHEVYDIQTEHGYYCTNGIVVHNCFIGEIADTLEDILDHTKRAGMIFQNGSGVGFNVSNLRAKGEVLSGKGTSSGPISFMRGWDAFAGSIRSGGRTRRSAVLVCMDADHPDIKEFITCKRVEEQKAKILIEGGIPSKEAYATVAFQNANHSIRVSDDFMKAVEADGKWNTVNRGNKRVNSTISAKDLLMLAAEVCHECAEPGIQFDDRMNKDNPVPSLGKIHSTNPCQPGFATVLTPEGIKTFDDIGAGSVIWSGIQWTKITDKLYTGAKPVYQYITTAGTFIGTKEHRVFENGERVEVKDADAIDCAYTRPAQKPIKIWQNYVVDGWVFGDGSVHKASNNLVYLNLGEADVDIFMSCYPDFHQESRPGLNKYAHLVRTAIKAEDLGLTYEREIPYRYLTGAQDVVCSFLKGLYNANGSVCGGRVTLKASSFKVIQGVQQMLSSVGIRSYFTTNKKHNVEFENGTYECKESYDLNITRDKTLFAELIGFDHLSKKERLKKAVESKPSYKPIKTTYDIIKNVELGECPVWDIRVEAEEHSYWTGGLLVSNCSEFSAINSAACNLSSLNLVKYFDIESDTFDWAQFDLDVETMITAMDIIVSPAYYPTKEITEVTQKTRPLGLGFSNLGTLLVLKGFAYDSDQARTFAAEITRRMTLAAYKTSVKLAYRLGEYPAYLENKAVNFEICQRLIGFHAHSSNGEDQLLSDLMKFGLRNSQVTLIAPCGTIGYAMDCETFGIEPLFSLCTLKALAGGGTLEIIPESIKQALHRAFLKNGGTAEQLASWTTMELLGTLREIAPDSAKVFDTANEISWRGHLGMMAACQPHLSSAISKTINMKDDCTSDEIFLAYITAWKMELKAIALYRDGSKGMQPMTDMNKKSVKPLEAKVEVVSSLQPKPMRRKLANTRDAVVHRFDISGFDGYLTVGMYDDGKPGELFISASKEGATMGGLLDSFAIAISFALQHGVPLESLIEKFMDTSFQPNGLTSDAQVPMCSSIVDYIFRWLEKNFILKDLGDEFFEDKKEAHKVFEHVKSIKKSYDGPPCAYCGGLTQRLGTCYVCTNCGNTSGCS